MSTQTPAQEEFASLLAKNSAAADSSDDRPHREDRDIEAREEAQRGRDDEDEDEEDRYRASQIDAAMRMPTLDGPASATGGGADIRLPPVSFDRGRSTGVKGVIADARSYENARKSTWKHRAKAVRRSVFGLGDLGGLAAADGGKGSDSDNSSGSERDAGEEESFLQRWRESRRLELEDEARGGTIRHRRTSPSVRLYGRLDEVDALGYLDAIEKVGRETVVLVFVYDHESQVSAAVESALRPLVSTYPMVHFVKVHYDDIEFDNAAVPALLAYRNQGDLFANMTGVIEMIPDDDDFGTDSLKRLLQNHNVL